MKAHLKLLRPHQWSKNILVFAGWIFGGHVGQPALLLLDLAVFLIFCAISSAVYIFNDIVDRERDRRHPSKRNRPIASGEVSVPTAAVLGGGLALGALVGAWALGWSTLACVLLYVGNNLLYSLFFKHIAVIDVLSIAFGFILRLLAGIYVFGDLPTSWAVLCVLFLALFLAIAKRRAEMHNLTAQGISQRPVLSGYTIDYLDSLLNSAATMAILCYALFTVTSGKNPTLVVTLPIVYYAVMHYKRIVMVRQDGEEPEKILVKERRILALILLWLVAYVIIDYGNVHLFR